MSDFGVTRWPVAKKPYKCEWCGEEIHRCERHFKFTGVWQGEWQNFRLHEECHEAYCEEDPFGDGFMPFENERPEPLPVLIYCPS